MSSSHPRKKFRWRIFLFLAALLLFGKTGAVAEETGYRPRLKNALELARRELILEKERISKEEEIQQGELKQWSQQLSDQVGELVDRKLSLARKQSRLEKLREERSRLRQRQGSIEQDRSQVKLVLADIHRKISDLLETLPPARHRDEQKKHIREIEQLLAQPDRQAADLIAVLKLFDSLLRESYSTDVFRQIIRNARGYQEPAEVVRAGQMFYAYRGKESGDFGLTLAAPQETEEYRWEDNLPGQVRKMLAEVINTADPSPKIFNLPVDVTQQMAAKQRYGTNRLWDYILSGGPVMIPLGGIAGLALILILERWIFLLRQGRSSDEIARAVIDECRLGHFDQAEKQAREKPGIIARTLWACISQRRRGTAAMEDAIQEVILHEQPRLERFLSGIGILAGVAPLLGLLGTVTGMIETFNTITVFGSGEPRLMAGGISEALVTTVAGLVVAIPILLIHGYLSSRADHLIADTERYAATLLNLLGEKVRPVFASQGGRNETAG